MDRVRGLMFFFLFVFLAAYPGYAQKESESGIKILYIGFADHLAVEGGRLSHSFAQYSSYARAAALQLSAGQIQLFSDWLERCRVFSLTAPDVLVSDPNHPGAEEYNTLQVEYQGKTIDLAWRGVSTWNDPSQKELLDKAVSELTKLSIRLIREADLL